MRKRSDLSLSARSPLARWLAAALLTGGLILTAVAAPPTKVAQAPATAASPLYGVELLIFRASAPGAGEDWDAQPPGRGFGNLVAHSGTAPQVVKLLGNDEYHLSNLEGGLKNSGAWRPLAHAAWIQTAANWGTHAGLALSDLGINVPGLSGTVYLERAPIYLHLGFDVAYATGAATYTIKEMRSVKYNDKQYFDHPAFGIIAVVTPIKRAADSSAAR